MVDWRALLLISFAFYFDGGLSDRRFPRKFHPTVNPVVKDGKRSGESMLTPSTSTLTPFITPKRPPTGITFSTAANSESCKDDPNAECQLYNATALCDPTGMYYAWAHRSCPNYCGLCQVTTLASTTSTSLGPSDPSQACKDGLNCRVYNSSKICIMNGPYYPWARKYCPLYCGFCQAPTRTVPCSDKLANCDEYPPDLCTNELYRLWREDNCRKFCGVCSGIDTVIDYPSTVG